MKVSSTSLLLLLILVGPLRNLLNSTKSSRRLKVFNFNLEYETFCELTQPKLFKTFSRIKRKRNVFLKDFLIFPYSTFYFRIQYLGYPDNIKYIKYDFDIKNVTSWSFDCDSKCKTFVISQYSCTIYFIIFLNDFIYLWRRIQTHCLLFWSSMTRE